MSLLINILVNLFRLLGNAYARVLRRPADFVWINVTGTLPEFELSGWGLRLRQRLAPRPATPTLETIRARLDRILTDGRPRGVILRVENLNAGWAALEELRTELYRFKSNSKKVVAYLIDGDTHSYYLASVADKIFASPLSTLNVVGLHTRVNFLKDTLARAGLEAEVLAVSPYKSAADAISRSDFSRESREQVERLLDRRFDEIVAAISVGRDMPAGKTRVLIDRAPYSAAEAVSEGLLDGALYEDELPERLGEGERPAKLVEWAVAKKALSVPYRRRTRRVVGLVRVEGTIVRGRSRRLPIPVPVLGSDQAGSDSVVAALRSAEKNRRVGAILLYVDSRGGDALASDLIWREVERICSRKPVVVLMGNVAGSGGYYVSASANAIVARKNTITGSIGVVLVRPVAANLFRKLKINPVAIERGARADLLDPRRRPTSDELAVLQGQLENFYREFKNRVERGRGLPPDTLEGIAGGRVWTGVEALERNLVDEIGGFRVALSRARELAGIPERASDAIVMKITPPAGRPVPGEPIRETVEAMYDALSELASVARVWALAPYEISDD